MNLFTYLDAPTPHSPKAPPSLVFAAELLFWQQVDGEPRDPWDYLALSLPEIQSEWQTETPRLEFWTTKKRFLRPAKQVLLHSEAWNADVAEPENFPTRVTITKSGYSAAQIEATFWTAIGGPAPYHDSVALAWFCRKNDVVALKAILREALAHSNYTERQN